MQINSELKTKISLQMVLGEVQSDEKKKFFIGEISFSHSKSIISVIANNVAHQISD